MPDSKLPSPDASRAHAARDDFHTLADDLIAKLAPDEVLLCGFTGEDSDFVRFNQGTVRQAGSVLQRGFHVNLIQGQRQLATSITLSGDLAGDKARLGRELEGLRQRIRHVPEDPYLHYATEVNSTDEHARNTLVEPGDAVSAIQDGGKGKDLVGIYASGAIYVGHQNSLGQRNWYDTRNFNFDWSFYHQADKAVKSSYAGFDWEPDALGRKIEVANRQLGALQRKPRTIDPGRYRVYLAPAAVHDVVGILSWGGFGMKSLKTQQSPLLKLANGEVSLSEAVHLIENPAEGVAPGFQDEGFIRPPQVPLVEGGKLVGQLISPRSAKEFGVETNGASAMEAPDSLQMAPGGLPHDDVLKTLGTGLYIGNVWYLNYSDRAACRTTGMTRFATFWVENGEIVAPLNVMRFDETVYRMLGENLIDLTKESELILDPGSYFQRAIGSGQVPGALVEDFNLTL